MQDQSTSGLSDVRPLKRVVSLDGVRALAVVLTSVAHIAPARMRGSFLGVDVFFVLSGFLITSILLHDFARFGRIHLREFYLRRLRRLLPAVVLLIAVFTAVVLLSHPSRRELVVAAVVDLAVLTYTFNWTDAAGHQPPWQVDHLWSLSVEEQFYLLWPLLLILALPRLTRPRMIALTATLATLSAIAQGVVYLHTRTTAWAYLTSPLHAQGILLGCLLAQLYTWRTADALMVRLARSKLVLVGALAVLLVLAFELDLDRLNAYEGGMTLASIAAAVVIFSLVARETTGESDGLLRLFSSRPLVAIGKRSYSIYLWENFIAWALTSTLRGTLWWVPANIVLTLACAEFSYRFVERRFLTPTKRPPAAFQEPTSQAGQSGSTEAR